ncbi:MAG: hypothetical protein R3332_13995 [Pseudohongiellaceae bacterium]|nr:hypothetical protein [Pseudohongiellaceae bacterium]
MLRNLYHFVSFLILSMLFSSQAYSLPDAQHMRGAHAAGNWLGNTRGFAEPTPVVDLEGVPALQAGNISVTVNRVVDSEDATNFIEDIVVVMQNVQIGDTVSLNTAGFWMYKNVGTGAFGVTFSSTGNSNLSDVDGFNGVEVSISIPAVEEGDLVEAYTDGLDDITGDAKQLVLSVLSSAPVFFCPSAIQYRLWSRVRQKRDPHSGNGVFVFGFNGY